MILSPDPSLEELAVWWQQEYWFKSRVSWKWSDYFYQDFMLFFGKDRRPRDITRADVAEFKEWLKKKGRSDSRIVRYFEFGRRFYRLLDERELVEKDWNPFQGQLPRNIPVRIKDGFK